MANIDGLPVNSAVTHAEFMSRTEDTSTTGKVDFNNTTDSTTSADGSIHTAGGLGVEKSLNVGLNANVSGELIVGGETTLNDTLNASNIIAADVSANTLLASGNIVSSSGNISGGNFSAAGAITSLVSVSAPQINAGDIDATGDVSAATINTTGNVTVGGNLIVNGTTTTVNSTNVSTVDKNITINQGGNDASSEGAGLTVDRAGTDGSLIYKDASATKWAAGSLGSEVDLVGTTSTQTLTNKTLTSPVSNGGTFNTPNLVGASADIITTTEQSSTPSTPSSGLRKIYSKSDGFYQLDSAGNETKIGSGSGSGGGAVNLITDGSADNASATIFIPYSDSPSTTRPVDGTGGSPAVTSSVSTINPLIGSKSFLLTKPASNTQGQGWSIPTTSLDVAYRAKSLKVSIDYVVNSGTFLAGSNNSESDVILYFYDITNAKLVEPSNIKFFSNSSTISDKIEATVQFDYNCTAFRTILHCQSSSTLAYELKVDNVTVSPQSSVYAPATTAWKEFTPTFTGFGTVTNVKAFWRRVGKNLEVYGRGTSGTPTASGATITFASLGVNIDTSLIVSDTTRGQVFGEFQRENADSASFSIGARSDFTNYVYVSDSNTQGGLRDSDGSAILVSNEKFSFKFSVPILGWDASSRVSDSYDGREISGQVTISSNLTMTTNSPILFPVVTKDTTGSYNASTGQIKIPSAGEYEFTLTEAYNNTSGFYVLLYKNGTPVSLMSYSSAAGILTMSYPAKINCNAGDLIDVRPSNNTNALQYSAYASGSGYVPKFSWKKNQNSQAISASEKVFASYSTSAGQSIPNNSATTVLFGTRLEDTHGAYNTSNGRITLPRAGVGYINVTINFSSATGATYYVQIYKNGSLYKSGVNIAATTWGASFNGMVSGVAGDYFDIRVYQNSGAAKSLDVNSANNHFDFFMI